MSSENNKKEREWIAFNRSFLEIYQISGLIFATKDIENETNLDILVKTLKLNCSNLFDDFLLFSNNVFRVYSITEINKIVNPDKHQESITLFSFMKNFYKIKSEEDRKFSKWKKRNKDIRSEIGKARKKFSAHLDSQSIHREVSFDLYFEDMNNFIKDTFIFFDFLYKKDSVLKNSFDKEINPAGGSNIPSETAESRRSIMINRISYLKENCFDKKKVSILNML